MPKGGGAIVPASRATRFVSTLAMKSPAPGGRAVGPKVSNPSSAACPSSDPSSNWRTAAPAPAPGRPAKPESRMPVQNPDRRRAAIVVRKGMAGYGQFCAVARAHEVLGGRWTVLVVRELLSGARRFSEIRRGIPRISRTMLSERLQALADLGVILREDGANGPEYAVTDAGAELTDHIRALGVWGQRWLPRQAETEDFDLEPLLLDMKRRVRPATLPVDPMMVRFEVRGHRPRFPASQGPGNFALRPQSGISRAAGGARQARDARGVVARRHQLFRRTPLRHGS